MARKRPSTASDQSTSTLSSLSPSSVSRLRRRRSRRSSLPASGDSTCLTMGSSQPEESGSRSDQDGVPSLDLDSLVPRFDITEPLLAGAADGMHLFPSNRWMDSMTTTASPFSACLRSVSPWSTRVSIFPGDLGHVQNAVSQILRRRLHCIDDILGATPVSIEGVSISSCLVPPEAQRGVLCAGRVAVVRICGDRPSLPLDIHADRIVLFDPHPGDRLVGSVSHIAKGHIGLLVCGIYNCRIRTTDQFLNLGYSLVEDTEAEIITLNSRDEEKAIDTDVQEGDGALEAEGQSSTVKNIDNRRPKRVFKLIAESGLRLPHGWPLEIKQNTILPLVVTSVSSHSKHVLIEAEIDQQILHETQLPKPEIDGGIEIVTSISNEASFSRKRSVELDHLDNENVAELSDRVASTPPLKRKKLSSSKAVGNAAVIDHAIQRDGLGIQNSDLDSKKKKKKMKKKNTKSELDNSVKEVETKSPQLSSEQRRFAEVENSSIDRDMEQSTPLNTSKETILSAVLDHTERSKKLKKNKKRSLSHEG